jgi:flagellar biosynthesis/type III secretory pathway M-ring protein FliF/YscJ
MLKAVRRFAIRLHHDESGPNTVEWVLLIIVALLILVAIYVFVKKVVLEGLKSGAEELEKKQGDAQGVGG